MYTAQQPGAGMSTDFDSRASAITRGEGILFPKIDGPSDTTILGHAPGYSIVLSAIYSTLGRNYFTVQLVQNAINSISPVILFLIAGNLLSWRVGAISGIIAAFSHHQSYYSNLILSDSLCPLPILIGFYLLVKTGLNGRGASIGYVAAGFMFGLSAWIRPNPMLLGSFCAILLIATYRSRRVVKSACLVAVTSILTITPIPIRNYVLYKEFVPIQIGVGLNLWQGLADVSDGRFGAKTDDEAIQQEVEWYGNPLYGDSWVSPDGIMRDRARLRRSLDVIIQHPAWYAGSLFRRMGEMMKDSAYAPLIFRSTDTKLKDTLNELRADQSKLLRRQELQVVSINRAPLTIGTNLVWLRAPARAVQRLTKESALLFALAGLFIILAVSLRRTMSILIVPLYYLLFQSIMHTEFRYTLAMRYFLIILAAIVWTMLFSLAIKLRRTPSEVRAPAGKQRL